LVKFAIISNFLLKTENKIKKSNQLVTKHGSGMTVKTNFESQENVKQSVHQRPIRKG